jgi:hypothetical protein
MDVLIHIGSAKTGSSTVQRMLARNANLLLRKHGIATVVNDTTLLDCARGKNATLTLPSGASRLIYSDERLLSRIASAGEAARVIEMIAGRADRIGILCYVRRQDEFVVSSYVTRLLAGETSTFERIPRRPALDLRRQLSFWEEAAGTANVAVRRYGCEYLLNRNIIDDFVEAAGLEKARLRHLYNANVSPTTDILELQRRVNLELSSVPQRRFIVKSLLQVEGRGQKLGMSRRDRKTIDEVCREGDDAIARRFLAEPRLFTHDYPDDEARQPSLTMNELYRIVCDFAALFGKTVAHPGPQRDRAAMRWAAGTLLELSSGQNAHEPEAQAVPKGRSAFWQQAAPAVRSSLAGIVRRLPWSTLALALCQGSDILDAIGVLC